MVLPELTIDEAVLGNIQDWLQDHEHPFELVAAGSFHVMRPEGRRNEAVLLGRWGDPLLTHIKLQPMRQTMRVAGAEEHHDEDIVGHDELRVLAGPHGLLALAICLDFCEASSTPIGSLWPKLGPALVLVPSMGEAPTNKRHDVRARELRAQHMTRVLMASQHPQKPTAVGHAWFDEGQADNSPVLLLRVD